MEAFAAEEPESTDSVDSAFEDVEAFAAEEPAAEENDQPFEDVEAFAGEDEPAEEENNEPFEDVDTFSIEEEPVLSDENFDEVDAFADEVEMPAEETEVKEALGSESALSQIEEKLSDPDAAKTNADEIGLFKSLLALSSFIAGSSRDSFASFRIRMILEYLIAKMSGRPGLLATAEAFLASGVLGEEYQAKIETATDEELSNDMIKKVLLYMKSLTESLEDRVLAQALCVNVDNIISRIDSESIA